MGMGLSLLAEPASCTTNPFTAVLSSTPYEGLCASPHSSSKSTERPSPGESPGECTGSRSAGIGVVSNASRPYSYVTEVARTCQAQTRRLEEIRVQRMHEAHNEFAAGLVQNPTLPVPSKVMIKMISPFGQLGLWAPS
jgi:hypothetical protein